MISRYLATKCDPTIDNDLRAIRSGYGSIYSPGSPLYYNLYEPLRLSIPQMQTYSFPIKPMEIEKNMNMPVFTFLSKEEQEEYRKKERERMEKDVFLFSER